MKRKVKFTTDIYDQETELLQVLKASLIYLRIHSYSHFYLLVK